MKYNKETKELSFVLSSDALKVIKQWDSGIDKDDKFNKIIIESEAIPSDIFNDETAISNADTLDTLIADSLNTNPSALFGVVQQMALKDFIKSPTFKRYFADQNVDIDDLSVVDELDHRLPDTPSGQGQQNQESPPETTGDFGFDIPEL